MRLNWRALQDFSFLVDLVGRLYLDEHVVESVFRTEHIYFRIQILFLFIDFGLLLVDFFQVFDGGLHVFDWVFEGGVGYHEFADAWGLEHLKGIDHGFVLDVFANASFHLVLSINLL